MLRNQVKDKLQALFAAYTKNLPSKLEAIEAQWLNLLAHWDQKQFQTFHREVHSLCGSAGTYGYAALGLSARQLEIYLKLLLNNEAITVEQQKDITYLLNELKITYTKSVPDLFTDTTIPAVQSESSIVYIIDKDKNFIADIGKQIKESGYNLMQITDVAKMINTLQTTKPVALIIDVESVDEQYIPLIKDVQRQLNTSFPLICTAQQGDIMTRLKAIRMGNNVFLQKPVDIFYLTQTLNKLCGFSSNEPYRILIIDDSRSLAEYFALILQEVGMTTYFITNPLLLINTIEDFQPDLLLMDVYMPECTGLELAAVLRQDMQYTRLPIIFLSTEDNRYKQLSALNLGGDDFLTKPILPQHLIEAVKSRAKRAGILSSFMMRDSLTGLLNHTTILQRLDLEVARAIRQTEIVSFAMLDIDNFKAINDEYGHPMGDKVIKTLSNFLSTSLRKTDAVGRYGGEEFAVILPNTNKESSLKLFEMLREKFSHIYHQLGDKRLHITFSTGIASYSKDMQAKNLIMAADQALYIAKRAGRNQVYYVDPSK